MQATDEMLYAVSMHRTQVNLDDWIYERLRVRSQRTGRSIAALVRDVLGKHLQERTEDDMVYEDGLGRIEGIARSPEGSSPDHDDIYDDEG